MGDIDNYIEIRQPVSGKSIAVKHLFIHLCKAAGGVEEKKQQHLELQKQVEKTKQIALQRPRKSEIELSFGKIEKKLNELTDEEYWLKSQQKATSAELKEKLAMIETQVKALEDKAKFNYSAKLAEINSSYAAQIGEMSKRINGLKAQLGSLQQKPKPAKQQLWKKQESKKQGIDSSRKSILSAVQQRINEKQQHIAEVKKHIRRTEQLYNSLKGKTNPEDLRGIKAKIEHFKQQLKNYKNINSALNKKMII